MNRQPYHLMRHWYQTDTSDDEPDYEGTQSSTIPGWGDREIVGVDWSRRGWVEVTFLIPGEGVPWENGRPA